MPQEQYNILNISTDCSGWYVYGARFYDPAIGRFGSIDPLMEWHFNYTPYHYTFNNPINFKDLDGRDTTIVLPNVVIVGYRARNNYVEKYHPHPEWGFIWYGRNGRDGTNPYAHGPWLDWDPLEFINLWARQSSYERPGKPDAIDMAEESTKAAAEASKETPDKEIGEKYTGPSKKRDAHGNDIKDADDLDNKNDTIVVRSDSIDYRYEADDHVIRWRAAYKGDTLVKYRKSKTWKKINK